MDEYMEDYNEIMDETMENYDQYMDDAMTYIRMPMMMLDMLDNYDYDISDYY